MNSLLEERVAFLKTGASRSGLRLPAGGGHPTVMADQDLVKGHPHQPAGERGGGRRRGRPHPGRDGGGERAGGIEVHDSGPGLSEQARQSLFQPTISFKKRGMGLGLSIARKGALLSGGDIVLVKGELGGAGIPRAAARGDQWQPSAF